MEHVIHSQIVQHLNTHKILSDQHHVFRQRRSRESQLIITLQSNPSKCEVIRITRKRNLIAATYAINSSSLTL